MLKSSSHTNRLIGGRQMIAGACKGKSGKPLMRHVHGTIGKRKNAAGGARRLVARRRTVTGVPATPTRRPTPKTACAAHRTASQRPDNAYTGRGCDAELTVGLAQETDAMHAERHPLCEIDRWATKCARCFFIKWKRTNQTPPWLNPKPRFLVGAWGLGCIWCAASKHSTTVQARRVEHMRQNKAQGRCQQAVSRASTWGAYSQRALGSTKSIFMAIYQHQSTDLHRLSERCFHLPAAHFEGLIDPRGHLTHRTAHSHDLPSVGQIRSTSHSGDSCLPDRHEMMPSTVRDTLVASSSQRRQPSCPSSPSLPDEASAPAGCIAVGSSTDPFRGRVPQIPEWVDIWASTTSSLSIWGHLHRH